MEKSAMEKRNFNSENTKILSTKSRYMDPNTKGVIKTELDPNKVSAGHGNSHSLFDGIEKDFLWTYTSVTIIALYTTHPRPLLQFMIPCIVISMPVSHMSDILPSPRDSWLLQNVGNYLSVYIYIYILGNYFLMIMSQKKSHNSRHVITAIANSPWSTQTWPLTLLQAYRWYSDRSSVLW